MKTLPTHYLDLAGFSLEPARRDAVLANGITVGSRIELDLDAIRVEDEDLVRALEAYDLKVRSFWDAYVETGSAGECLVTQRTLATYVKVDKKGSKIYLKEQVKALENINGLSGAMKDLLGGVLDEAKLKALGLEYVVDGNLITVTLPLKGKQLWPASLGGPAGRGEFSREVVLKISHAKSHDRKSQRLLEVKVSAREVWPA